jgi:hypothetical protein
VRIGPEPYDGPSAAALRAEGEVLARYYERSLPGSG